MFYIGACKPANTISLREELQFMGLEAKAPSFERVVRMGPSRIRRIVETPVIAGLIFIEERLFDPATSFDDCWPNRPRPFRLVRNPAQGGEFAKIYDYDIEPLEHYARSMSKITAVTNEHPELNDGYFFADGERVEIDKGPFTGLRGVVKKTDGVHHVVALDHYQYPLTFHHTLLSSKGKRAWEATREE